MINLYTSNDFPFLRQQPPFYLLIKDRTAGKIHNSGFQLPAPSYSGYFYDGTYSLYFIDESNIHADPFTTFDLESEYQLVKFISLCKDLIKESCSACGVNSR